MIHHASESTDVYGYNDDNAHFRTSPTAHTRGSRRLDGAGNDGPGSFVICHIVGFLLCVTKMKPRTRIRLTWFYVIFGACVTGSLFATNRYSHTMTASPTDMRKVEPVSTSFCESVTIESTALMSVYKFTSEPELNNNSTKLLYSYLTMLNRKEYTYWRFYLLKGSVMSAYVCGNVDLYQIKGKENLDKWIKAYDTYGTTSVDYISAFDCLPGSSHPAMVNVTATDSDQYYYIVLDSLMRYGPTLHINAEFTLRRKLYILHNNDSALVCEDTFSCTVPLVAQSSEVVVFYINPLAMTGVSVNSTCTPRVYMYVLVFGILPFLSGILITCAIKKYSRKHSNTESDVSDNDIFTVSNSGRLCEHLGHTNEGIHIEMSPPRYSEVETFNPPRYSEVETCPPPSYEEAVNNK